MVVCLQNGQTALSIAQRLGYISVVDTLAGVTEVTETIPTLFKNGFRKINNKINMRSPSLKVVSEILTIKST
jgi:hypothetical protein